MSRVQESQGRGSIAPGRSPRSGCATGARHGAALLVILLALVARDRHNLGAQERRPFVVNQFEASTDVEAEYFRDETRSRDGLRTIIERSILRQLIRSSFGGYSFDPRLLRYRLNVELGYDLFSSRFDTPFETQIPRHRSASATRVNYDLLVQLFPERMNSLNLWTRRRDFLLSQLLYDTFSVQEQAYGVRFDTRWPVAPSFLQFETRDITERGLFESSHEESQDLLYQVRKEFGENNRLDVLYEYLRLRRLTTYHVASPRKIREEEDTQRGEVYHEYRFGTHQRSSLSSQISIFDQTGSFPFRHFLARERLILQHTPNFQTYYGLSYQQTDVRENSTRWETVEAGLRHQLYQNLVSRIEGRLRHTDETDVSWNEADILGNASYRRRNPLGELFVNALARETYRHYSSRLGTANTISDYFEALQEFRNRLRLYYRIEDQHLDVGPHQGTVITNSTMQSVGYEIPWARWAWLQEYRHRDDTLGLTDSLRSEVRGTFRLPWRSSLNARLVDEEIDYHERLEQSRLLSGQLSYVLPFARTGLWDIEAIYDDQEGIVNQQHWRARSTLEWQWRKMRFQFSGQYGLFENEAAQQRGLHLLFTVSRKFR